MDVDLLLDGNHAAPFSEYAFKLEEVDLVEPEVRRNAMTSALHASDRVDGRLSDSPGCVPQFAGVTGAPAVEMEEASMFDDGMESRVCNQFRTSCSLIE